MEDSASRYDEELLDGSVQQATGSKRSVTLLSCVSAAVGMAIGGGAATAFFLLVVLPRTNSPIPPPPFPHVICGACAGALNGSFYGTGRMAIKIAGVNLDFSWSVTYDFYAADGTMNARMTPIQNPFPHPMRAFDCKGVPFQVDVNACNITMIDDCMRASRTMGKATGSQDVFWDGASNITQYQLEKGPFGSQVVRVVLIRQPSISPDSLEQ